MKYGLAAGLLTAAIGVGMAMADSDKTPPAGSMTMAQVSSKLQAQGLTVSKIKFDDGHYEVKAVDTAGHKQKLNVNPQSGAILSQSVDTDG